MEYLEIERKFLIRSSEYRIQAIDKVNITQGFLNTHPERTVRIRITGNAAFLTVKGIGNDSGTTRFEWETAIKPSEATKLLALCEDFPIQKIRYQVPFLGNIFEVDEFHEHNKGLIVAEIELPHENAFFEKPDWLGDEVTGQPQYYNSQLSKQPYTTWPKKE
ncbi:MAG: CYTH domain-containing protein [Bacteroidota bacterium]